MLSVSSPKVPGEMGEAGWGLEEAGLGFPVGSSTPRVVSIRGPIASATAAGSRRASWLATASACRAPVRSTGTRKVNGRP